MRLTCKKLVSFLLTLLVVSLVIFNNSVRKSDYFTGEARGNYCVVYNYLRAGDLANAHNHHPISLAIHSTVHYVHLLPDQVLSFGDFISYALFVDHRTADALHNLTRYWHCAERAAAKVSVHVVWEKDPFAGGCGRLPRHSALGPCADFDAKKSLPKWVTPVWIYPINVLRNVARLGAKTRLHIVADMENIFSTNFTNFVRNETEKMLSATEKYVLIFRARMFHQKVFARGHHIPQVEEWGEYSMSNGTITSWPVEYKRKSWEPQFIMPSDAPLHFEQMPTRVYDHQVLVQELCRAGYKFRVLSHVFNTHAGFKTRMSELELAIKRVGKAKSRLAERSFNDYLDQRYPDSKDDCPKHY